MGAAVIGVMAVLFLIIFGVFLLIVILYLLNLQNTIKAASPENRKMPASNVWLLFIPLFNIYWMYVVVKKISTTIEAEYASKGQILETPNPTYKVGMAFVILNIISFVLALIQSPQTFSVYAAMRTGDVDIITTASEQNANMGLSTLSSMVSLAVLILWIVHWVQTAGYKNKMKMLPNNKVESQIFGQI